MGQLSTEEPAGNVAVTPADWLGRFAAAVDTADAAVIAALFADAATFRELLVMSWDFRNFVGAEAIGVGIAASPRARAIRDLRVRGGWEPMVQELDDGRHVMAFVEFGTDVGHGNGFLNLVESDGGLKAVGFVVQLTELDGHPETVGANRPIGKERGAVPGRRSWEADHDPEFAEADPVVLVVGSGHNGLSIAARLGRLEVPTLVVEKNPRVGDNWRNRYEGLALHDPLGLDHLPYMSMPTSWPNFTPARKFGDFLKSYAVLLDIPVWCGSQVTSTSYDVEAREWVVNLRRENGSDRTLRVRHLIVATGDNGIPKMPEVKGGDSFEGTVVHSGEYRGGAPWAGKRALVVGTGVSGHDIAQDLYEQGAEVMMLQRGATYVINASTHHDLFFASYYEDGPGPENADLMGAVLPFGSFPALGPGFVAAAAERDRQLLDGLAAAGFELGTGPDGQGVAGLVFGENRTGYYFNIGASELIVEGKVGIRQGQISELTADGARLDDGTELPADLVVFATGYESARESARSVLGGLVDRLPEVLTVGADGEMTGVWRHSGHDGLWFMFSHGIYYTRFYSRLLALQIKAAEEGIAITAP